MSRPGDPGTLHWDSFERLAERLQEALREDPSRDLSTLLPAPAQRRERLIALHAMIPVELECRWGQNRPVTLENYLNRFPELGPAATLPVALIYQEYRVRRKYGHNPSLDSYKERFPNQFADLLCELRTRPDIGATTAPVSPSTSDRPAATDPAPRPSTEGAGSRSFVPVGEGYELLQLLGRGEFGEVFKARAPGGGMVAMKRIFRPLDDKATQRELKALDVVCRLNHPFLLQTQLYWVDDQRLMIVMELADNSLADWLNECKAAQQAGIPVEPLLEYFHQAAEALDFLHNQQPPVIHRDIKPANLLRVKGFAKVADFGLARETFASGQSMARVTSCGTPAFMPPEMWNGRAHPNSDQYSLAVTYVEMRLGRHCFTAANAFQMAFQHMGGQPHLEGLLPDEQVVLRRAMALEPEKRFPTCVEFVRALKEATAPPKPPVVAPKQGSRLALVSLALAVVAVVVALLSRPGPTTPPHMSEVSWLPNGGWEPVDRHDVFRDGVGGGYYRQIQRTLSGQSVIMLLVPGQGTGADAETYYIMQNKVWNDLYRAFMDDQRSEELRRRYGSGQGREVLVKDRDEWEKGASAPGINRAVLGVGEGRGMIPVFRVTVTEAHCFAEWMGGRLPSVEQHKNAARLDELLPKVRSGLRNDLALDLGNEGPWRVDRGEVDVSRIGVRQLVSNGKEFTRDFIPSPNSQSARIPLTEWYGFESWRVVVVGRSYTAPPPTDDYMGDSAGCTEANEEISFRVVIEQPRTQSAASASGTSTPTGQSSAPRR